MVKLLNQPINGQLGDELIKLLASGKYDSVDIVVAFAKNSGVLRLKRAIEKFRSGGGRVNVYVGVDLGGTSYEALTNLRAISDSLRIIHSEQGQTFHTKLYHFSGTSDATLIVGSNNLTGGGLWTNMETSILLTSTPDNLNEVQKTVDSYLSGLCALGEAIFPIDSQDDLDKLLISGYVEREILPGKFRKRTSESNPNGAKLFGSGPHASAPTLKDKIGNRTSPPRQHDAKTPGPRSTEMEEYFGKTMWYDTQRLTGGARNQLDLSKKSLLVRGDPKGTIMDIGDRKFILGAVGFFGVDPSDESTVKYVTLNFEGVDFVDNKIYFPSGDKSNRTWRIQFNGVSSRGERLSSILRSKGKGAAYLPEKILTFTRESEDYYSVSVFTYSDRERILNESIIEFRNGQQIGHRPLGLI